jgi:copper chaperone
MSAPSETLLNVQGMSCGNCVRHVGEALRGVEGVTDVEVRLDEGRALVRHDGRATLERLIAALDEAGYDGSAA